MNNDLDRNGRNGKVTQLLKHTDELAAQPADWMPWNYRDTLQKLAVPQNS